MIVVSHGGEEIIFSGPKVMLLRAQVANFCPALREGEHIPGYSQFK